MAKSRYLENKTFFLQIKKFINYTSRATLWQKNSFVEEVTFKEQTHPISHLQQHSHWTRQMKQAESFQH